MPTAKPEDLKGGDPEHNAAQLRAVLDGAKHALSRRRAAQRRRLPRRRRTRRANLRDGLDRASRAARQRRRQGDARPSRQNLERLSGIAMSDVLARIEAYKRQEIAAAKAAIPQAEIERRARAAAAAARLRGSHRAASRRRTAGADRGGQEGEPVEGPDPRRFRSAVLARAYAEGGATCLSVLTDEPSFQGKPEYLTRPARRPACRPCARISCSSPIRSSRRAPGAPIASSSSWRASPTRRPAR